MSFRCHFLGLHGKSFKATYIPSIDADVVTEYKFENICPRCGKRTVIAHEKWDEISQTYKPA